MGRGPDSYWGKIRGWLSGITAPRAFQRDREPGEGEPCEGETTGEWDPSPRVNPEGFDPDLLEKQSDIVVELGLEPAEFITGLIDAHDGRLRQKEFTDYTAWSKATVSRVLSDLEEEGRIERVRVGNENVVCLPGHDDVDDVYTAGNNPDSPTA